jgi:hypothetical protein
LLLVARRQQSRLVDQVGEIGADKSGRPLRHYGKIDVGTKLHAIGVNFQDCLAPGAVGPVDENLAIEASGAQKRRVQDLGSVGGGEDDNALGRVEAVHLDEKLIQGAFALVMTTGASRHAARFAERIELVDEDDARRQFLRLREQVADPCRTHADEQLDELRAADREERHAGLAGDGLGQQGFAGPWRADEEHTARQLASEQSEPLGLPQEANDLREFLLRFFLAGGVREGDAGFPLGVDSCLALSERHDPRLRPHAAQGVSPEADEQSYGQKPGHEGGEERTVGFAAELHPALAQLVGQADVLNANRPESPGVAACRNFGAQRAAHLARRHDYLLDVPRFQPSAELRVRKLLRRSAQECPQQHHAGKERKAVGEKRALPRTAEASTTARLR